ncbi:putative membrane protease YugP [Peptoclostridium acidaminophilum DSM 3953]|uniref:Putative membrane protease YugP n=1 Tax=Peptoclostridium acidaminophilum DSM 3953 TaxID=1286171 RepID=W8U799_PEPAC|nr:zinc metallopeptidase [Peptoclostridium acidaminophilum]AHM56766.1 putative membrane protease YugP [Peptoclostridium acidaminophilum DSM 3953]
MYYGFDPTFILMIPAIILTLYAQMKVKTTFEKYLRVQSKKGYTGAQVADYMLHSNGIEDVRIEMVQGHLSDHYDPRSKVLRLSRDVYAGTSIASVSVAAHEVGHAIQHAHGYAPLRIRSMLVPVANLGSSLAWIFIMAGFIISPAFLDMGILLFLGAVLFQIVTLPVEFNASSRALAGLESGNIVYQDEIRYSKRVLNAAALTYVAAAAAAVMQLIRLLVLRNQRD